MELGLTQVSCTGDFVTEALETLEMMYQDLYLALLILSTLVAERALPPTSNMCYIVSENKTCWA